MKPMEGLSRGEFNKRRMGFRELASGEGLDGLLIAHLPDVRYLCGFSGSSGMAILLRERGYFLTDFRYREQAAQEVKGLKTVVYETGMDEAVAKVLSRYRGLRLGFDGATIPYAGVIALRRWLKGTIRLIPLKGSLALLRAPKSRAELDIVRKGIRIAESALREALAGTDKGDTESGLALAVDGAARRAGAEAPSFETIVAGGKRAAMVHARPSRARLAGAVVIDWGVVYGGYHTDSTRTVAFGRVSPELKKAHRLVLQARERALDKVKPGVQARDVDRAARVIVEKAGYGDAFGHGLGHGVGLEVHERPFLGKTSRDVLEEGMIVTVEPGIYLPGTGGVRLEDMVLVTAHGAELLNTLPRSLDLADYR